MDGDQSFLMLLRDLGTRLGLDLTPDRDDGAVMLQFEDGISLHIMDSGAGKACLIADTGIDLSRATADHRSRVLDLALRINFATLMSTRLSVAQSPQKTIVLTLSDQTSAMDGQGLLENLEFLVSKATDLRAMMVELADETPVPALPDHQEIGDYFSRRA